MTKREHHRVHVHLHEHQHRRLLNGHRVQLHAEQLHGGKHAIVLSTRQARKLATAARNHKGIRLQLDPHEIHHNGGSFSGGASGATKFFRKVGRALKGVATAGLNAGGQQFLSGLASTALTDAGIPAPIAQAVGTAGVVGARHVAGVGRRRPVHRGGALKHDIGRFVKKHAPRVRKALGHIIQAGLNNGGEQLLKRHAQEKLVSHGFNPDIAGFVGDEAVHQGRQLTGLGRRRVRRGGSFLY